MEGHQGSAASLSTCSGLRCVLYRRGNPNKRKGFKPSLGDMPSSHLCSRMCKDVYAGILLKVTSGKPKMPTPTHPPASCALDLCVTWEGITDCNVEKPVYTRLEPLSSQISSGDRPTKLLFTFFSLRGFFRVGSATHLIEPLDGSGEEGQHAVYHAKHLQQKTGTCGVSDVEVENILGPRFLATFKHQPWVSSCMPLCGQP